MNFRIYMIGRKLHIDKITDEEVSDVDNDGVSHFESNTVLINKD